MEGKEFLESVGGRVRKLREKLGYSQLKVGQALGYTDKSSKSVMSMIESGDRDIPLSKIKELAKLLNTSPQYLMGWSDDPSPNAPLQESRMKRVPIYDRIPCGSLAEEEGILIGDMEIPVEWDGDYMLKASGDSMCPDIRDGDLVCIHLSSEIPHNGKVCAVRVGNESTLKKFYKFDDHIELRPINPEYETIMVIGAKMALVRIIGTAIAINRKL